MDYLNFRMNIRSVQYFKEWFSLVLEWQFRSSYLEQRTNLEKCSHHFPLEILQLRISYYAYQFWILKFSAYAFFSKCLLCCSLRLRNICGLLTHENESCTLSWKTVRMSHVSQLIFHSGCTIFKFYFIQMVIYSPFHSLFSVFRWYLLMLCTKYYSI